MSLAAGVFDQACIAGPETPNGSVAEPDFEFAGYQDYILAPRSGMPINKCPRRLLRKNNMFRALRFS
jgi:hypothetical protein